MDCVDRLKNFKRNLSALEGAGKRFPEFRISATSYGLPEGALQ
jgi:hypothetical protein